MPRWYHLRRGELLVKVKFYLVDDYSIYWYRRGGGLRFRYGLGVVVGGYDRSKWGSWALFVHGGNHETYVKTHRYVALPKNDPQLLFSAVLQAHVTSALGLVPRHMPVAVSGEDPRGELVRALAEIGESRYVVVLQGGEVRGRSCRALVVSPIYNIDDSAFDGRCAVRFVPYPPLGEVRKALEKPLRVPLRVVRDPWDLLRESTWGIVSGE